MADEKRIQRVDVPIDNVFTVHITQEGYPLMRIAFVRAGGKVATFQLVLSPIACMQHMAPTIVYDPAITKPVLIKADS